MSSDRLYRLLPAFTRLRDAQGGRTLEALTGVVSDELDRVQANIEDLYADWFIETCDEWVVPYIGDLLGVGPRYAFNLGQASLRPFVAQTLGFRRRKGTAAMLEDVGRSLTGWPTRAVEFFRRLAITEHLNHQREAAVRTPDLRDTNALELLGGPFERAHHFAEVRRIASRRGRYGLANVGLFVWRLLALEEVADGDWTRQPPGTPDPGAGPGRFRFSPLGVDLHLFAPSRTIDVNARVKEPDVPGPLRRRPLYEELLAARASLAAGETPSYTWFDPDVPVLRLRVVGETADIPPEDIQICDLSDWTTLPAPEAPNVRVSVDPVLGRFAFLTETPAAVGVNYSHGFSAEIGSGCYDRSDGFTDESALQRYPVSVADPTATADTALQSAIAQWVSDGQPDAVFEILDSSPYAVSDLAVPAGRQVILRAADHQRPVLQLGGPWRWTLEEGAGARLDGFLVTGGTLELEAVISDPSSEVVDHDVTIRHCTLVPGSAAGVVSVPTSIGRLTVTLEKSIAGRVDLASGLAGYQGVLAASDTIIDGVSGASPAVAATDATLERVTVLGTTAVETLTLASDCLFTDLVTVERKQSGCVRFSYVKPGSIVPRCHRCQPALAIAQDPTADPDLLAARIVPELTSVHYGDPGYCQLHLTIAEEIRTGASDGSEMGAFQLLHQPQREANLQAGLDEYLRVGLEAGILFVT